MFEPGKEYYIAFSKMQAELFDQSIKKTKEGHKWMYAPLDVIQEAIFPLMKSHGFSLESSRFFIGNQIFLRTRLVHNESLQGVEDVSPISNIITDNYDAKEVAGNTTYNRRYALLVMFNIMLEEDDLESKPGKPQGQSNYTNPPFSGVSLSPEQIDTLNKAIKSVKNPESLEKSMLRAMNFAKIADIDQSQYGRALAYLKKAING